MDVHPYQAAWRTRDLDSWGKALAPDVVLYSPVLKTPFKGREAAIELFGVLFDTIGTLEITEEYIKGDSHAFFWRADIRGRRIEGVDRLRHDEHGKISEISVLIRPLVDIATFAAATGGPLATKRGPIRGALARLATGPLGAIFAIVDAVASRLIQRR